MAAGDGGGATLRDRIGPTAQGLADPTFPRCQHIGLDRDANRIAITNRGEDRAGLPETVERLLLGRVSEEAPAVPPSSDTETPNRPKRPSEIDDDELVDLLRAHRFNMRAAAADRKIVLAQPRVFGVEDALAYIADDELVEVTPKSIRLRKQLLDAKARKRAKKAAQA